ncbi:hypothetical protein JVT61DRAFT_14017 [Boletus reticuloceps]|uniref:Uncharacterized protein n=1 Tax=Boletus reticuloceps TaxID=495285 RepID=A0A8I2YUI9_9AGAM|nr:hypothetical protein JVT61DRAFT_14017 [Boletus reticuloceps]
MACHSLAGQSAREAFAHTEAIWARVVELEAEFWPNECEEGALVMSSPRYPGPSAVLSSMTHEQDRDADVQVQRLS